MGRQLKVEECKTARDFERYINRQGIVVEVRQNGTSHRVYKFPEKGISIPVPQHPGDIPRGTRHSIMKMLLKVIAVGMIILAAASFFLGAA